MLAKNCHIACLLVLVAALGVASCQGKVEGGQSCGAGQTMCTGGCATVATDARNCGACGNVCATDLVCQAGQCVCSPGLLSCSGSCVPSNAAHCGSCTTTCTGTEVCSNGTCKSSCPTGETQCSDGACVSPTGGDTTHCGGCNPCPTGSTCNAGVCMSVTGVGGMGGNMGTAGSIGTGGTGGTVACNPLPAIPRRLWRMSAEQWGGAVKDLLGLAAAPVLRNRGGQAQYAFFGDATLDVDENFQFALYQAAQGEVLPEIPPRITQLAPCSDTTPAGQTLCAQTFVETFGKKAFRRPLTEDEVAGLMAVYSQGAMQSYDAAIALVVQAVIISPSFVYRTELGPHDADRRRRREVSRHHADPPRGRQPARLPVPGLAARRRADGGGRRRRLATAAGITARSTACWRCPPSSST